MEAEVKVRFGAFCVTPNDKGELEFENGAGTKTSIPAEEVTEKMNKAQSLDEALEFLRESGAFINVENSRVMISSTPGGTQIFFRDEPGRKITLDKELPENVIQEILNVNIYDDSRAVEKILESNNIIEDKSEELEVTLSSEENDINMDVNNASNVHDNDIMDKGAISQSRDAREERAFNEDRVLSEREVEEMRRIRREQGRDGGMDR